jgi:peroxiredoxin
VRGRVTDDGDQPVERATVLIEKWQGVETLGLKTMTDAGGEFVIEHAPSDAFSIVAFARGYEPSALDVPADGGPLKVVLHGRKPPSPPLGVGAQAPDFALTATDGTRIVLAELRGKFVFLDFWATWCGPCVVELPHVRELHEAIKARSDILVVGVSLDSDRKALDRFVTEKKLAWLQVFGEGGAEKAADEFGVSSIPATFLIGPNGKIVAAGLRGPSLKEHVLRLLNETPATDGK